MRDEEPAPGAGEMQRSRLLPIEVLENLCFTWQSQQELGCWLYHKDCYLDIHRQWILNIPVTFVP